MRAALLTCDITHKCFECFAFIETSMKNLILWWKNAFFQIGGIDKLRIRRDAHEFDSNDDDIELMENDDPLPQMERKHDHKYAEDMKENVKKLNYDIK